MDRQQIGWIFALLAGINLYFILVTKKPNKRIIFYFMFGIFSFMSGKMQKQGMMLWDLVLFLSFCIIGVFNAAVGSSLVINIKNRKKPKEIKETGIF